MNALWGSIPQELQLVQKWCVAGKDKSPYTHTGHRASVTDPECWGDWYSVTTVAQEGGAHIGFVLGEDDPYTCIDLDVKEDTPPEQLAFFHKVIEHFDSYTEYSRSGKGFHIWIRGSIGAGCRQNGMEIYSQERFIICTGNTFRSGPIEERQEQLDAVMAQLRTNKAPGVALEEVGAVLTDEALWEKASNAANGEKFLKLWAGNWKELGYPSQSEADSALVQFLCFLSPANEQVRRMFRFSELGKREKATKNDRYINLTLAHERSLLARDAKREAKQNEVGRALAEKLMSRVDETPHKNSVQLLDVPTRPKPSQIEWPPGLVGVIAQWMYSIAPRPVREVAIVSALGVVAGLCGRAYNISGSGLNLYIVLVARSGVGKEAMHSGISKLVHSLAGGGTALFTKFINFSDFASGPALIKSFGKEEINSFLNVAGEWGRKLRGMAEDGGSSAHASLRTALTNLYQKSSAGTIVGGIGYSDKEKDVDATNGIAYSMVGETTPDTFYEALTDTMMQDGFMSRFVVIEYAGERPPLSAIPPIPFPEEAKATLTAMTQVAWYFCQEKAAGAVEVQQNEGAAKILYDFDKHCDAEINRSDDEAWRQMWNRAHLKALKIAALLCIGDNPDFPVVAEVHAQWALDVVNRDIRIMSHKIMDGDVGNGDMNRERKLLSVMREYLRAPIAVGYKLPDEMRQQGIVARKFLQNRVQRVNSFTGHRLGQSQALDSALRSLADSGHIVEMSKDKIPAEWVFSGKCYRILALPDVG
jgi:hypothetical protein